MTAQQHADAIRELDPFTYQIVVDALCVRSMDFVGDRLASDGGDETADIVRELERVANDDEAQYFNPDHYRSQPFAR